MHLRALCEKVCVGPPYCSLVVLTQGSIDIVAHTFKSLVEVKPIRFSTQVGQHIQQNIAIGGFFQPARMRWWR